MEFINLILKYICCFFIINNVYCSESRITNIDYLDKDGYQRTLFHLHNEDLSELGLKCNNSNELLENIKKLAMNGDVYIYSGEHDEEDIKHLGECKDATSAEGRKELIDKLEEILKINKLCVYNTYEDLVSLNTDIIVITYKPLIVPYNLDYQNNYYSENIKNIIERNFGRFKNFPQCECSDIYPFLKGLENEDNQRIFPEKAEFGIYTIVFNKNGEQKLLQISKDDNSLINTYTNIFVTFPQYCYGIDIVYQDPKKTDISDDGLKPFKIPEVCLIKKDELKDEKEDKIDDEIMNEMEENEIEGKGKWERRIKTKPEHKKSSGQDEKKCCNTKSCRG